MVLAQGTWVSQGTFCRSVTRACARVHQKAWGVVWSGVIWVYKLPLSCPCWEPGHPRAAWWPWASPRRMASDFLTWCMWLVVTCSGNPGSVLHPLLLPSEPLLGCHLGTPRPTSPLPAVPIPFLVLNPITASAPRRPSFPLRHRFPWLQSTFPDLGPVTPGTAELPCSILLPGSWLGQRKPQPLARSLETSSDSGGPRAPCFLCS